jgi:hypothetical protein
MQAIGPRAACLFAFAFAFGFSLGFASGSPVGGWGFILGGHWCACLLPRCAEVDVGEATSISVAALSSLQELPARFALGIDSILRVRLSSFVSTSRPQALALLTVFG